MPLSGTRLTADPSMPVGGMIRRAETPRFDLRQPAHWRGIAAAEQGGQKSMFWPGLSNGLPDRARPLRLIDAELAGS
jgi:hypothetical protein